MQNLDPVNQTSKDAIIPTPEIQIDDESTPKLFKLPLEVLGVILQRYIPHEGKLKLRQVHSLFQIIFDNYIGFKVTLDNEDPEAKINFVSKLAIRKAVIQNLTSTISVKNHSLFEEIILYPQFLQELIVKGNIDANLFSDIVRKCISLKKLELSGECNVTNSKGVDEIKKEENSRNVLPEVDIFSSVPPEQRYLPKCRHLKLLLNQDSSELPLDINCEAVMATMISIRSLVLERAVLQGWISERFSASRLALMAAIFLERNPNLDSFFFGVIYEHLLDDNEEIPVNEEDVKLHPIIQEKLKNVGELININKFGISTQSSEMFLWKEFLKRQVNLHHASFTVDVADGVFSADMFRPCRNTLNQLIIRGKFLTSFNFNWIEDCHNLKELCLHNIDQNNQPLSALHAINLSSVPACMESLVLFQTVIRTDEILSALRKLKLKTLVLFKTGNTGGETGVNAECLRLIFNCRSLQSILLVRFVAQSPLEAASVLKMLQTMNDGGSHRQVILTDGIVPQELDSEEGEDSEDESPPPLIDMSELANLGLDAFVCDNIDDTLTNDQGQVGEPTSVTNACAAMQIEKAKNELNNCPIPGENSEYEDLEEEKATIKSKFKFNKPKRNIVNPSAHNPQSSSTVTSNEPISISNASEIVAQTQLAEPNLLPKIAEEKSPQISSPECSPHPQEAEDSKKPSLTPEEQIEKESTNSELKNNNNPVDATEVENSSELEDSSSSDWNDAAWLDMSDDEFSDSGLDNDGDDEFEDDEFEDEFELNDLDIEFFEHVAGAVGAHNLHFVMNLDNQNDQEQMLELLNPMAQNGNNLQLGFVLDGVVDIQGVDAKRSRWIAAEDEESGQLIYTLKISID